MCQSLPFPPFSPTHTHPQGGRSQPRKPAAQIYVHPQARGGSAESAISGQKTVSGGSVEPPKPSPASGGGGAKGSEKPHPPPQQQSQSSSAKDREQSSRPLSNQGSSGKVANRGYKKVTDSDHRDKDRDRDRSRSSGNKRPRPPPSSHKTSSTEQRRKPHPPSKKEREGPTPPTN